MSHELSRRLSIVVPHLYPNLVNNPLTGDYYLQNDSDGKGTYLVWKTEKVTKPTDTELANAKEAAVDADWWRALRKIRDDKRLGKTLIPKEEVEKIMKKYNQPPEMVDMFMDFIIGDIPALSLPPLKTQRPDFFTVST